jgi:type IX secretion system PorP/SprF family membrane protein
MKKTIFLIVLALMLAITSTSYGQQDPQYTHYMYNMNVVNPAYAGSRETLSLGLLYRTQWVGIDGAPETFTANVHAPIGSNLGVGLSVIADQIGPVKEQNAYADVSYTINTSEDGRLAFGVKGGVTMFNAALTGLDLPDGTQGSDGIDDLFTNDGEGTFPNVGAGLYYYTDKFYAGVSVPNFLETPHFGENENGGKTIASEKWHGFLTLGYVFDISEDIDFKPSTMVKAVPGSPLSVDISGNFLFNDRFELGLGYRFGDSIDGLVSFLVTDDFRVGYSYDYTLTDLGDYNNGSHEILLQYDVNMSRKNLKSPRFF